MTITAEKVEYVAHLSRMSLEEDEKKRFAAQMDSILNYVEKLNELETGDTEPLVHLSDRVNVFRKDKKTPSLSRKEAMRNAPKSSEGCFEVPSIIE